MKYFLSTVFLACLLCAELFAGISPGKDAKFFDLCWHLDPQLFRWNINKQDLLEEDPGDRLVYEWKIAAPVDGTYPDTDTNMTL